MNEIIFERRGAAGLVTLNRPQALNAVTHAMVLALRGELDRWADDPAITRVVIRLPVGAHFPPAAISARSTTSAAPAATTRRGNSGAMNIRSTQRSSASASPMWR